jgi:hypothetical protein
LCWEEAARKARDFLVCRIVALEMKALGASETVARRVAGNARSWWRNSYRLINSVLTIAYFDRLGVPCLS